MIVLKVVDNDTKQGIPFVSIATNPLETASSYTDSLGYISIRNSTSEVTFSSIGYQTITLKATDFASIREINLIPISYVLESVEIKQKESAKKFRLGYFRDKNMTASSGSIGFAEYNNVYSNYVATYIENAERDTMLFISKLLYNLTNKPKHLNYLVETLKIPKTTCETTRLRIHLFTVNTETKAPEKELLKKNIIVFNDCNAKGDLIVDISNQNIRMPVDGLFVGLEYIDLEPKKKKIYFPFYVTKFYSQNAKTYESYQQKKWVKINNGSQAQFGIEVIK